MLRCVFTPEQEPDAAAAGIRDALDSLPVTQLHTDEPELEDVVVALLLKNRMHKRGVGSIGPCRAFVE